MQTVSQLVDTLYIRITDICIRASAARLPGTMLDRLAVAESIRTPTGSSHSLLVTALNGLDRTVAGRSALGARLQASSTTLRPSTLVLVDALAA